MVLWQFWLSLVYGSKCVGRILTESMSYFLYLCDCSVTYFAFLEAWNWVVAGQHLNASHPRSSFWPNPNITIFSGIYFWKTLNSHISSTVRAFDLIPKLRARPEYQLYSNTKHKNVILCDSHQHYLDIVTTQSLLDKPSGPQSNAIKYKFMTWIWSLFCLQMSYHMFVSHILVFYT